MIIKNFDNFILERKKFEFESRISQLENEKINEGVREVLIGLSLLAGVVAGTVDANAQSVKTKIKDASTSIEKVMSNPVELENIINQLEEKGMEDAAETIQKRSEEVLDKLEDFKKDNVIRTKKTSSIEEVQKKLKTGWAISEFSLDTVKQNIETSSDLKNKQTSVDTTSFLIEPSQLFEAGSFELKQSFVGDLTSEIESIFEGGNIILRVDIESSTDKQRVSPGLMDLLKSLGFKSDNEGLSKARNKAVSELTKQIFKNNGDGTVPLIESITKWEEGKGELGAVTPQDPEARYVKITIYSVSNEMSQKNVGEQPPLTLEDVISQNFTLIKVEKEKDINPPGKLKKSTKPSKGKGSNCPVFKK